jgi:Phenylalanyl-tRNA synthetase beta subunit
VFLDSPDEVLPDEREHLSVALVGVHIFEIVDLLYVLGSELALPNLQLASSELPGMHPGRAAEILVAGKPSGVIGEVDPRVLMSYGIDGRVAWLELNLGKILSGPLGKRSYRSVSKYPSSDVDLAFDVPESVTSASILGCLRKAGSDLLQQVKLFDTYSGNATEEGHRSLAYRLRFQASDRTLTDDEVSALRSKCIQLVEEKTDARLRL